MAAAFAPCLDILPPPQRALWPELAATPPDFTLYGGTAIALRLGHRPSADFDFFSAVSFEPAILMAQVPYLVGGQVRQSAANTLTCTIEHCGAVQLSFFGGLSLGQVALAEPVEGPAFAVAALIDLAGMKAAVITQRAELKDYLDIHALMTIGQIDVPEMLAAAAVIYGPTFNPLISLKALAYHDDVSALPAAIRRDIEVAVRRVDPNRLPTLSAIRSWKHP
jgi:hypothetical protein